MSESDPIRVFPRGGRWIVDHGNSVWAYCPTRSEAIVAGTEAARDQHRELVIDDTEVAQFALPPLAAVADPADRRGATRMDDVAFSEHVNRRLAAVSREMLARFLEGFDPDTATDEDLARQTLLTDLARAERDRHMPLSEHEEGQLDRLIAGQPPQSRDMYTEVRNTNARHVLYMLRGLALLREAGASAESSPADPADEPTAG